MIFSGDSLFWSGEIPASVGDVHDGMRIEAALARPGSLVAGKVVELAGRDVTVKWLRGQVQAGVWQMQVRVTTPETVSTIAIEAVRVQDAVVQ